ncbi:hypothetical protein MPSEU_000545900 [Mayamaea pseudoterrestris]|nr:hypothetical protein MPSEU_000545900 [Mayamaea pseudoterrestris]
MDKNDSTRTPTSSKDSLASRNSSSRSERVQREDKDDSNHRRSLHQGKRKRRPQSLFGTSTATSFSQSSAEEANGNGSNGASCSVQGSQSNQLGTAASSPSDSQPSLLAPESKLSQLGINSTTSRSSNKSSSLFGAVMKSVHVQQSQSQIQQQNAASSLPSTFAASVHSPPPTATAAAKRQEPARNLLDIVNALSPFQFKSPVGKRRRMQLDLNEHDGNDNEDGWMDSPLRQPELANEWRELVLQDQDDNLLPLIDDWTIKKSVSVVYTYLKTLPHQQGGLFATNARIEWLARQQFVKGRIRSTACAEEASIQLQQALLYWEYAAAPYVTRHADGVNGSSGRQGKVNTLQSLKSASSNGTDKVTKKDAKQKGKLQLQTSQGAMHIFDQSQQDSKAMPPPFSAAASRNKPCGEMDDKARDAARKCEWREALISLYQSWLQQMECMSMDEHDVNEASCPSKCYFYAVGAGHTVLFRAAPDFSSNSNHTSISKLLPQVIMSSSSRFFRDNLQQRGVKLFFLRPYKGSSAFDEAAMSTAMAQSHPKSTSIANATGTQDKASSSRNKSEASPGTKAELVALRQSQVRGATVGPHVKVTMDRHNYRQANEEKETLERQAKLVPPLVMSGIDDCAAFLECYVNMYGQVHFEPESTAELNTDDSNYYDSGLAASHLPKLTCRDLGPFAHASLQSLRLTQQKDAVGTLTRAAMTMSQPQDKDGTSHNRLEIHGSILPCAMRSVLSATVGCLQHAARSSVLTAASSGQDLAKDSSKNLQLPASQESLLSLSDTSSSETSPGSTYLQTNNEFHLLMQTSVHTGEDGHDGNDTVSFAGRARRKSGRGIKNVGYAGSQSLYEANDGGFLMQVVWEGGRPRALAYKLEQSQSADADKST